ncbi:MAG TPA: tRNA (N(6)-L-threonylcarbamoyladenosine(37)-C(2))-methylthiotransferase MtaB, partial [Waddliaceae bacterium]
MDNQQSKKFKVVTLGCRTNQYESQAYRDQLVELGMVPAAENEHADLCIVNSCTVTESADSSSRHEIRQLARKNPNSRIVVTGCSVENHPEKISAIEGVTDLIRNKDKENLVAILFPNLDAPEFSIKHFEAHTRAFVKVQDGCNSFCTYCILPYVRGRSKSRTKEEIIREVENLIASGYKEIVLTGINVGDYDGNKSKEESPERLADLVRAVDKMPGLERLRVSSIDPDEVDDDLSDAILNGKTTCHSMHIVLQSGSNIILKRMNRKYTRQVFMRTIELLREADPDFTFTTDVIVAFPGETDSDFAETLSVMKETKFAKVHMFPYSPRERTRAALYPNQIPPEIMRARKQEVMRLSEQMAAQLREHFLFRKMKVLTENINNENSDEIFGHTENFLPVIIK